MPEVPQITEKELHVFWKQSSYFSRPLLSTEDHEIKIIQRGSYNLDAGPDFLDAVVKIDDRLYEGDVEIHIKARDWMTHGHDKDPAYNRVLLHVALDESATPKELRCENGRVVLQLIVPGTDLPLNRSSKTSAGESLPLPFCPLRKTSFSKMASTVLAAGKRRLELKTERFREQIQETTWDQLLYRGICEALGYSKNQKPFRQLADLVPIDLLFAELRNRREIAPEVFVSSILFGAAGLLNNTEKGACDADVDAYVTPRLELWRKLQHALQLRSLPEASWQFFRLRPQNFPTRRVAALAELILRFYRNGMLEMLVGIFSKEPGKVKSIIKELRNLFIVSIMQGFWQAYYDFKSKKAYGSDKAPGALLGEKMADEIIINVIIPVINLFAKETGNAILGNCISEVYSAYPRLQSNIITRKMRRQLFEHAQDRRQIYAGSELQQGLIHLHKSYCLPLDCEACLAITPQIDTAQKES